MEHGKNRFFNICEAYESMLGKRNSMTVDARRYNAINESLEGYSSQNIIDMWCEAFKNKVCIIVGGYGFLCYGDGLYGVLSMNFLDNSENYGARWIEEELSAVKIFDSISEAKIFLSEIPQMSDGKISEEWKNKYFPGARIENVNEMKPIRIGNAIGGKYEMGESVDESYDVEAYDSVYIGRTDDYYSEEEDDSVFSRPTWTWSESPDDRGFAKEGPVYKLTDDGKRDFFEWLDAYQVGYSLGSGKALHGRNESPEEEWDFLTSPSNGLSVEVEGNSSISAQKFESARRRNLRGRVIGESYSSARNMGNHKPWYNPSLDEIDTDDDTDEANEANELNDQILKLKEFIGWNPVGGVSIVSGSFKPKYGGNAVPFKPMSLEEFINSAYHVCTAEAHDEVRASTVLVGGEAYIADSYTFSNLLKDDYILNDYPEYYMHEVALSFSSYDGTLTLVELLHDSYYGHGPYVFDESSGRDYILSKILSSYPFLRDYVDNSDKRIIKFSLPPTMANDIMGVANKHSERQPTLKSLEDEERYYYGTYDKETGNYESKYDIDVRNAYKDRFGGGKEYVG